jgi:hypothetical protein
MAEIKLIVSSSDPNSTPDAAAAALEQLVKQGGNAAGRIIEDWCKP